MQNCCHGLCFSDCLILRCSPLFFSFLCDVLATDASLLHASVAACRTEDGQAIRDVVTGIGCERSWPVTFLWLKPRFSFFSTRSPLTPVKKFLLLNVYPRVNRYETSCLPESKPETTRRNISNYHVQRPPFFIPFLFLAASRSHLVKIR